MEEVKTIINNTKDWYDLVDTALKIGLGALIAGSFTYITTKANHSHENKKKQYELKKQLLLEANDLSSKYFLKIHTLFLTYGGEQTKGKFLKDLESDWIDLYSEHNCIYNSRKEELETINSKLSLLNLDEAINLLTKYENLVLSFRIKISNNQIRFPHGNEEFFIEIKTIKQKYHKLLSEYLKNLN